MTIGTVEGLSNRLKRPSENCCESSTKVPTRALNCIIGWCSTTAPMCCQWRKVTNQSKFCCCFDSPSLSMSTKRTKLWWATYAGITNLNIPASDIWIPDTVLYNKYKFHLLFAFFYFDWHNFDQQCRWWLSTGIGYQTERPLRWNNHLGTAFNL